MVVHLLCGLAHATHIALPYLISLQLKPSCISWWLLPKYFLLSKCEEGSAPTSPNNMAVFWPPEPFREALGLAASLGFASQLLLPTKSYWMEVFIEVTKVPLASGQGCQI